MSDSRSFYMGMVPHPHDYTLEGVTEAYKIIGDHADMIAHYFDNGVPWPEAYEGKPHHPNVEDEINDRVKRYLPILSCTRNMRRLWRTLPI